MNRLGAILLPMLAGFLATIAVVSWHSRWWQRDTAAAAAPTATRIAMRQSTLRVVQVQVTAASPAAASPARMTPAPAVAQPDLQPGPIVSPAEPPGVPRESPARRFARGSRPARE